MTPMTVPSLSNWTQYTLDKCHLLEFGSALAMTEIPDWTEKQRMRDRLFPARYRKMEDEKLVVCPTPSSNKKVSQLRHALTANNITYFKIIAGITEDHSRCFPHTAAELSSNT